LTVDAGQRVREFIVSSCLSGDERGLTDDTDLQEIGVLDSFTTLALIGFLEEAFGVRLEADEVNSETFRTIGTIARLVHAKTERSSTDG